MCQACTCGRVLAQARVHVLQSSASRMVVLRFTTLSARDYRIATDEIQERKNYRECSNIKSARVSALTGSMPCRGFQHPSGIEPMSPNYIRLALATKPFVHIKYSRKKGICLIIFRHLQLIIWRTGLSYSDFSSWISRSDTKYENSWTQTFDRYILSHST